MGGFLCKLNPSVVGAGAAIDKSLVRLRLVNGDVYLENSESVTIDDNDTIRLTDSFQSVAREYGTGLCVFDYNHNEAEHTGLTGSYDHTGGDYERLFTCDTASFTADDANNNNILVISTGERAIITNYISTTQVVVCGMGWDTDFDDITFDIYPSPSVILGDNYHSYFSTSSTGCFSIHSYDFVSGENHDEIFNIEADIATDDVGAQSINVYANGYNHVDGLKLNYITGDLQPADIAHCMHIVINESGAASADATTDIDGITFETTNVSDAITHAIHVGNGFVEAFKVSGSSAGDPDYGYEVTGTTVVDRVNSGGAGDDSFINASVDQAILDSDNDYILIGNDDTFEIIEVILTTLASATCNLEFYYSVGAGSYTQFYPEDSTNDFTSSGQIKWKSADLTGWAKDDEAEVNGDITNAYYIKILRTRNNIVTLPKESYFKIYTSVSSGMTINGDGTITPTTIADADAANETLYYSSDQSKLVYKDSLGSVHDLW
jgi:hypothetical protein